MKKTQFGGLIVTSVLAASMIAALEFTTMYAVAQNVRSGKNITNVSNMTGSNTTNGGVGMVESVGIVDGLLFFFVGCIGAALYFASLQAHKIFGDEKNQENPIRAIWVAVFIFAGGTVAALYELQIGKPFTVSGTIFSVAIAGAGWQAMFSGHATASVASRSRLYETEVGKLREENNKLNQNYLRALEKISGMAPP